MKEVILISGGLLVGYLFFVRWLWKLEDWLDEVLFV